MLRKKEGDTLHITNGKGSLFVAEIVVANDKKCTVQIVEHRNIPNNRGYYLHIAIASRHLHNNCLILSFINNPQTVYIYCRSIKKWIKSLVSDIIFDKKFNNIAQYEVT